MALVAPLLLLFLLMAADLGRAFFMAVQLTNAAREGALFAAHNQGTESSAAQLDADTTTVINQEERTLSDPLICTNKVISILRNPVNGVTWSPQPTKGQTTYETITVTCTFAPLIGINPEPSFFTIKAQVSTWLVN
jgi:Flp pilus assembly protein TadG